MSNIFVAIKLVSASLTAKLNEHFGVKSQKGVTIIEYALLGSLIAAALVLSLQGLETDIEGLFSDLGAAL
jgi:pilus assembly protein Flp/PilA